MNADAIKFRCSSLGYIMTEPRSKSEGLSETCKGHLADKYVSEKYGRKTDVQNKYTIKGLQVEEDSITLYSLSKRSFFKKNEQTLCNDFICGTPDLFQGDHIEAATEVVDVKSSWDIFTFFRTTQDKLNKQYYWQLQGYMALTGAKTSRLVYCLVNTPESLINDEKRKLQWRMNVIDPDASKDYVEACKELDKLMVYDDIPREERLNEIIIPRDDKAIQSIYQRVKQCREYMNEKFFKQELKAVA